MGLEAVEVVLEIEECFKTSIPDSELEKILTVGELYELLIRRIKQRDSFSCLTSSIFYQIRQILLDNYNFNRRDIRSISLLRELIIPTIRFDFWQKLKKKLLINLPHLRRSTIFQLKGNVFPEHLVTLGDLARECSDLSTISPEFKLSDLNLVWQELCCIVAKVACIKPEELTPETNFVLDLGF